MPVKLGSAVIRAQLYETLVVWVHDLVGRISNSVTKELCNNFKYTWNKTLRQSGNFQFYGFITSITISITQTNTTKPMQRKDLGARLVSL